MSLTTFARSRSRVAIALIAGLAVVGAFSNAADAIVKPDGSRAGVMLETGQSVSYDPSHAITSGWWGHEGGSNGTGSGTTFLSMDASNGTGTTPDETSFAAMLASMGTADPANIWYAVVPTSADGSTEHPQITAGENAAEAFNWILFQNLGGGLNGNANTNDSVAFVSTLDEVKAWVNAGQHAQSFDSALKVHDADVPGTPISISPKGKSILNRWAAGTKLSLVAYVTTGAMDASLGGQVPILADDGTGHAETAWMPFTTVAKPGDAVRTSAGYDVAGPYAPTITTTATSSSTGTSLKATVRNKANSAATDATGTLQFAQYVGGVDQAPTSIPVSSGSATLTLPGFTTGSRTYDVTYVPDASAQTTYLTSAPKRVTVNPTKVSLSVTGGSTYDVLKATVSPKTAGKVTFKDGTTTIGSASVSTSTGIAQYKKLLTARKHTITATFTPTNTSYTVSSYTRSVYKPTISITKSPSTVHHGTYPKLTVKVVATGTSVSGTITITYDPASGSTRTISGTLSHGVKTVTLPKSVAGTTKITVKYNGHSPVLAASKSYSYRVY